MGGLLLDVVTLNLSNDWNVNQIVYVNLIYIIFVGCTYPMID